MIFDIIVKMLQEFRVPKDRKTLVIMVLILSFVLLLLVVAFSILNAILSFWPLSISLLLLGIYLLLRTAGSLMMFPGSFSYYRGSIERAYSKEMSKKIHRALANFRSLHKYFRTGVYVNTGESIHLAEHNVLYLVEVLQFFRDQGSLSRNKGMLLDRLNEVVRVYRVEEEGRDSIKKFLVGFQQDLESARRPSETTTSALDEAAKDAEESLRVFDQPEVGAAKDFYNQSYREKLYEIRFGVVLLKHNFHYENFHIDQEKLNLIIIKGMKEGVPLTDTRMVLFCNPNGAFIEQFPFETNYVRFYLEEGYNVCLWNYRGYLKSKGSPTIENNKKDVLKVYDFLGTQGYQIQVVHGYSIGGPTAIHLASERKVGLLVADRTFSSLVHLANRFGRVFTCIMKLVFWRDRTDYSQLFYSLDCEKVIIYDPNDEVIDNLSSLKTGMARLVTNLLESESDQTNSVNSDETSGMYLNARMALKKILFNSQSSSQTFFSEEFYNSLIYNSLLFMSDNPVESENTARNTSRKASKIPIQEAIDRLNSDLQREILVTTSTTHPKVEKIDRDVRQIVGTIRYVDSARMNIPTMSLERLTKIVNDSDALQEIKSYVQGLLAFGSYPLLNEELKTSISQREDAIIKLYNFSQELKIIEANLEAHHEREASHLKRLRLQFSKIAVVIHSNLSSSVYQRAGRILPVDCGHNGEFRTFQYRVLSSILRGHPSSQETLSQI